MSGKNIAKYKKTSLRLSSGEIVHIYASPKIGSALKELTDDMNLYEGVRLFEVISAAYEQGLKNGRREVIEKLEKIKLQTKYLPPGQPKKKKK
jgi:hypothetical protein